MIVPNRGNMVYGIENVIVSLYAKRMSNRDIEKQIREAYNFEVSTSTISRITEKVPEDIVALAEPSIRTRLFYCLDRWDRLELQGDQKENKHSTRTPRRW